ncbi:MAG: ribosome biogenesis GTPase Der [Candidatus Zixiibacteriota bacterium]
MIKDANDQEVGQAEAGARRPSPRTYLPLVAIIGRPNVGKSSLFNRFLRRRLAVVDDEPGVTRDRNYAICEWCGREFYLIDTGGMMPESDKAFDMSITRQAELAMSEADVIMFVVDAQTATEDVEEKIARMIQNARKPALLVGNKADDDQQEREMYSLLRLGLGDPHAVSAKAGRNIGDLLDTLIEALPDSPAVAIDDDSIRVAVIGRPNVGKSSLVNSLLGIERNIVSENAGTTRDAVDSPLVFEGRKYTLIDTAGLRRKMKVHEGLEFYTTLRATRALSTCDVALVVTDATAGLTSQDLRILRQAVSARRPLALIVNKWDLVEKDSKTADTLTRDLRDKLGDMSFVPIMYVSALLGKRTRKALELAGELRSRALQVIAVGELQEFLHQALARRTPPNDRGKEIRLSYLVQPETDPPTFVFFSNRPEKMPRSYIRFLTNRLRERFDLEGTPLRIKFKKK